MTFARRALHGGLVIGALGIAATAIARLPPHAYEYLFTIPAHQYDEVLPATLSAAVAVAGFWTIAAAVLAGILRRLDPTMGWVDMILGGYLGVWVVAFVAGNLLGPLGLLRPAVVWSVVLGSALVLVRLGPPSVPSARATPGLRLTALGFLLIGPGLLAIQLGAPLAPFMDVLATPASAQRVLTFGRYEPLDSDPYGYWDAGSQCPAAELLYAWLGLGSGVEYAALGQTAAIVPLVALLLLAVHRLGRTIGGDLTGGFASLLLLATIFMRVLPYSHGRTITYVLVAAGLAWFAEHPGTPVRRTLAALVLGTAVGSHAVVGALGMGVAALVLVVDACDLGIRKVVAGILLLAGASLVAFPEVVVGTRLSVPYPVVPMVQLLGVAVSVAAARAFAGHVPHARLVTRLLRAALMLLLVWATVRVPPLVGGLQDHWQRFPVLFYGSAAGLLAMLLADALRRSPIRLSPVAAALLLGMVAEKVSAEYWTSFADPRVRIAVQGFFRKVDYWYQFAWVVPVGYLAALAARVVGAPVAAFAVVAMLFWPWGENQDPNYYQQSIAGMWAEQAALAKGGYWGSTGHRRWGQSAQQLELARVLRDEIDAGRITFDTHVTHLEPYVVLYEDTILFSVYTGINDDTYVAGEWEPDISNVGGRVFPKREIRAALASRPPYVVVHDRTRNNRTLPEETSALVARTLGDYDEIFADDGMRLLRRPDLAPAG